MFKKSMALAALATTLLGVHVSSFAASPTDAVAAFHHALTSGNKDKALSLMSPEIAIYEAGYVERSRDEYAGHHLGGDMEFAKTTTRKVLKQSERVAGNTAVVWAETETTGTSRGTPLHVFGTETTVLEKKGGDWVIVHVHWSSRKAK